MAEMIPFEYKGVAYTKTLARADSRPEILVEDHGILTFSLDLDMGGSHQGVPLMALDKSDGNGGRAYDSRSMEYIAAIMAAFHVDRLSSIQGKYIYALHKADEAYHGYIKGLAPLPMERGEIVIFDEIWKRDGS